MHSTAGKPFPSTHLPGLKPVPSPDQKAALLPPGCLDCSTEQRDRRRPREGTEEGQPHVVLPKHPASLPSCLYCGPKNYRLRTAGSTDLPAAELVLWTESPARCFSQLCPDARVRTAPRELEGSQAASLLWTLNYERANQHAVKAFIGTACLLLLWLR